MVVPYKSGEFIGKSYENVFLVPIVFCTDDFFGVLDDGEGHWNGGSNYTDLIDIGIGRIPVTNIADAEAYAVKVKAQADADQTKLLADAIAKNGQPAVNFEIMKRQVEAIGDLASSTSSKTLILPTDITGILGSLETLMHSITKKGK